jgi:signal transduction histidine kinase
MIYLSLKQKAFLFYVLHALVNVYNTLTSSGHVYALLSPWISVEFLNITYKITPSLAIIFMSCFVITLFDLKKNSRWLYYLNVGVIYFFSVFMFMLFFFYTNGTILVYNKISSLLIQISLLLMLLSAFVIAYKRLSGSLYFLLGTGFLVLSIFLYVLHFLGRVDFGIWSIYISTLGRTIDIVFFSMTLGKRIKNIEAQRLENALLVEQSNKFNSTSYLLAGILHQFKLPIIYLGSEVLNLRVLQYKKAFEDKEEEGILKNMETQIESMNALVENFYSFYSSKSANTSFNLEVSIDKTLSILSSSLKAYNIEIKKEYQAFSVHSNEKIFNQVLLIILENAISILHERKVQNPMVEIFTCKNAKGVKIIIKDNAGGVDVQDVKKIFAVHYSKRKTNGLGIGLALAKNLIETKLNGKIEVVNDKKGAAFTIVL